MSKKIWIIIVMFVIRQLNLNLKFTILYQLLIKNEKIIPINHTVENPNIFDVDKNFND